MTSPPSVGVESDGGVVDDDVSPSGGVVGDVGDVGGVGGVVPVGVLPSVIDVPGMTTAELLAGAVDEPRFEVGDLHRDRPGERGTVSADSENVALPDGRIPVVESC